MHKHRGLLGRRSALAFSLMLIRKLVGSDDFGVHAKFTRGHDVRASRQDSNLLHNTAREQYFEHYRADTALFAA